MMGASSGSGSDIRAEQSDRRLIIISIRVFIYLYFSLRSILVQLSCVYAEGLMRCRYGSKVLEAIVRVFHPR